MTPLARSAEPNPWRQAALDAVFRAEAEPTTANLAAALEAAYRGDTWRVAGRVAELVESTPGASAALHALAARAFWRAGRISEALPIIDRLSEDTGDATALGLKALAAAARGERAGAARLGERLEALQPYDAARLQAIVQGRLAAGRWDGLLDLLKPERLRLRSDGSYPDYIVSTAITGLPEFLRAAGPGALNQIVSHGAALMRPTPGLGLILVEATIDGEGPVRLILDTGGSLALSLHKDVAESLGVKSVAPAYVQGIGGQEESGQALAREVQIGEIGLRRVLTRTIDLTGPLTAVADGVLGTGVFADGRFCLDLEQQTLTVNASAAEDAPGRRQPLWIVGDMKLMTPVAAAGKDALGLVDTGADLLAYSPQFLRSVFQQGQVRKQALGSAVGVGDAGDPGLWVSPPVRVEWAGRVLDEQHGIGVDALDDHIGPIIGAHAEVLLGMPAIRPMRRLTVDLPRAAMWIDWGPAASQPASAADGGK